MPEPARRLPDIAPQAAAPAAARSLYDQMFDQAVDALTRVARTTWHHSGPAQVVADPGRFDWSRFVADVVAAAAANVGSTDEALAGSRPEAWRALLLRELVAGTVGADDERLLEHRTEPVVVDVHVDDLLDQAGVGHAYTAADKEISVARDAAADPSLPEPERARRTGELDRLAERLAEQRAHDRARYGTAVMAHIEQAARAVGLGSTVNLDLTSQRPPGGPGVRHRGLEARLLQQAVVEVPLPGGGRAPLDRLGDAARASEYSTPTSRSATPGEDEPAAAQPPAAIRTAVPPAAVPHRRGVAPGATRGPRP
jgi:hypothetical protein